MRTVYFRFSVRNFLIWKRLQENNLKAELFLSRYVLFKALRIFLKINISTKLILFSFFLTIVSYPAFRETSIRGGQTEFEKELGRVNHFIRKPIVAEERPKRRVDTEGSSFT